MSEQQLWQILGAAFVGALAIAGLGILAGKFGARAWIASLESSISNAVKATQTNSGAIEAVDRRQREGISALDKRVTVLEGAARDQMARLDEIKATTQALHRRLDEHDQQESTDRQAIARELGALCQAVLGKSSAK